MNQFGLSVSELIGEGLLADAAAVDVAAAAAWSKLGSRSIPSLWWPVWKLFIGVWTCGVPAGELEISNVCIELIAICVSAG